MNPFRLLYHFITDKQIKLTHRAAVVIICVFSVFLIDNIIGFSFHYRVNSQLEDLKKADDIIVNPTSDSVTKSYAVKLRDRIGNRKNILDYLFFRTSSKTKKQTIISNPTQPANTKDSIIKNNYIFLVSSAGLCILAAFLSIWLNLFVGRKERDVSQNISLSIIYSTGFLTIGALLTVSLAQLPMLSVSWAVNYLINFVVQFATLWVLLVVYSWWDERRENSSK